MNAPATVSTTEQKAGQTTGGSSESAARRALDDLTAAWAAAPLAIQALAFVAALASIGSTTGADVPVAAGVTVALLVPAALVDWHQRRLPDVFVLAAALAFTAAAALTAGTSAGTDTATELTLTSIGAGIAVFAGPLLVLHLVSPRSMGFGDVKVTIVLGAAIGSIHWGLAMWALTGAAAAAAIVGAISRQRSVPFGPSLIGAAATTAATVAALGLDRIGI